MQVITIHAYKYCLRVWSENDNQDMTVGRNIRHAYSAALYSGMYIIAEGDIPW